MAAPNQQITPINKEQEKAILTYATKAHELLLNQFSMRTNLEAVDRDYQRENNWTKEQVRARIANRAGDSRKIQDVTVPIVMPQVEAALGYMVNVFLTGYPMFGVAGDPATEDAAMQMETVIAENAVTAAWARQFIMFFRDGLKYNLHGIECEWQQKTVYGIENSATSPNSAKAKKSIWAGNVMKRMDLYNTFFDPRVSPSEIYSEGEYAGYITLMSRIRLKKYINELYGNVPVSTALRAFESSPGGDPTSAVMSPMSYYIPIINPFPVMNRSSNQTFDWLAWANVDDMGSNKGIRYGNVYEVTKLYARILPADFGLRVPEVNTPQVWKFIIVNGTVVLFAERQTNAHNYIPIFFGQPIEDGLDYQTKSFATNVSDVQNLASALWTGHLASQRRLVGDRVLYDPLRVREKDINSTNPAAKIPVRPTAFGKPVGESVYAFPFRGEQTNSLIESATAVTNYANLINGQNPAQQGQFVKGNKTKQEYDDVMGHGNTRNQVMGISTETQVFTPLKEVVKLNILQFQQDTTLFNRDQGQSVDVKQGDLRQAAVHFKVSDGMLPTDKEMSTDEFQVALQTLLSSPQIGAGYDVPSLITYLFKTKGADLKDFEKSPAMRQYEQQQQTWQQAVMELTKIAAKGLDPAVITQLLTSIQQLMATQPQPSPQLQQEMQAKQGAPPPSANSAALESTQGNSPATQPPLSQKGNRNYGIKS
jgi:hypothetical protein